MKLKQLTNKKGEYESIIAKLEGGKSQAKIGDIRQIKKLMVTLEAGLIRAGYKSELLKLRREAVALANASKAKAAKAKLKVASGSKKRSK